MPRFFAEAAHLERRRAEGLRGELSRGRREAGSGAAQRPGGGAARGRADTHKRKSHETGPGAPTQIVTRRATRNGPCVPRGTKTQHRGAASPEKPGVLPPTPTASPRPGGRPPAPPAVRGADGTREPGNSVRPWPRRCPVPHRPQLSKASSSRTSSGRPGASAARLCSSSRS